MEKQDMENYLAHITKQIGEKENIHDYRLELQSSTNKGDGYMGMIRFGKIIGSNKTLDVVFKCRPLKPDFHPELIRSIYLNEIGFYEVIVPTFAKFQQEHNVDEPFNNTAHIYGSIKEEFKECFALKNLCIEGFSLWNRKQLMNEEHLKCALKTFAKFHSVSFAMQQLEPALYNQLSERLMPDLVKQADKQLDFYAQLAKSTRDIIPIFEGNLEYSEKLEHLAVNMEQILNDIYDYPKKNVINQGDCWCTNALYRYDDSTKDKPAEMKLLDFQFTKLGSPALDISYFFYASAPKIYCDRLDDFLEFYHDELSKHLAKFGVNAENVFSLDDLHEHWRKVSIFGLVLAIGVKKVMLVESQDAPDITDGAEDFLDKVVLSPENKAVYDRQIREIVEHFVERKLL